MLRIVISIGLVSTVALSAVSADKRPNVVLIMTDNHGAWTLGCYGNRDIRTPRIDRLAKEGMLFSRCYSSNPVCSPTRATWLTGLIPSQHGVHCFIHPSVQRGPKAFNTIKEFRSLPRILADAGYSCGLSGKWHLGDHLKPQEGFSFWVTKAAGSSSEFYNQQIVENGRVRKEPTYLTKFWTDRGIEFIEKNRQRPFFLYLAYNGPYGLSRLLLNPARNRHAKYYADKKLPSFPRAKMHPWLYNNRDYLNNPVSIRRYAAEVSAIDDGVGRILDTLRKHRLDKNTIVIFTADQGLAGGQSGIWGMGDHTRPLSAFDSTMHVPLIIRHPGHIPAGKTNSRMISNYDFYPSLLEYLGFADRIPKNPRRPGRSFAAALRGKPAKDWDNTIFYEFETVRAIRTDRWKYITRLKGGPTEFYDLQNDPGELANLAGQPKTSATQKKLHQQLGQFFARYADPKYDLSRKGTSKARFLLSARTPGVIASFRDRSFALDATTVQLAGQNVKIASDLRTIEGWKGKGDRATWLLNRVRAGQYSMVAEWSLPRGVDRSIPHCELNGKPLQMGIRRLAGKADEKWQRVPLGKVTLSAGNHRFVFGPQKPTAGPWLRLRSLRLIPVK